ncbi:hypothetical protein EON65_52400 [archaeon]|nr:MAG: hypothetical protein EON65_52400 [archaeon]
MSNSSEVTLVAAEAELADVRAVVENADLSYSISNRMVNNIVQNLLLQIGRDNQEQVEIWECRDKDGAGASEAQHDTYQ